jgi:DNA-binding CsgD family transcriptional regulator
LYCWLRRSSVRQATPIVLAVVAVGLNGPDSPSWWVALPLLWVVALVGSTPLTLAGACLAATAFVAGTLLRGHSLVHDGDADTLAAAVGLPVNAMVGRFAAERFARFVLRLHQLEHVVVDPSPAIRVPNFAPSTRVRRQLPTPRRAVRPECPRGRRYAGLRLTARQLEVVLLASDGLRHGEIAVCLGISVRQVERLLGDARTRAHAQTTSQLVAMLVALRLAPEPLPESAPTSCVAPGGG